MKKLKVRKDAQCMACLACVHACAEAFYKNYNDPDLACITIGEKKGVVKPSVCSQCGKCAKTCKQEAISQNAKGVYVIDKKKCTGCGECVAACPFGVMVKAEDKPVTSKCIACGICAKACPAEVLEIVTD